MKSSSVGHKTVGDPRRMAASILAALQASPVRRTEALRRIRRGYTARLQAADTEFVLSTVRQFLKGGRHRWVAYELIRYHRPTFERLTPSVLVALGEGINSWWTVDAFARTLAGPLWLRGRVPDGMIARWARSKDLWWRRAALVSTVALNVRSYGGRGDTRRTLAVCRMLVSDREPMVAKALSWALRELVPHDARAVKEFLKEHSASLAALVKREVTSKLDTGLKNPRPSRSSSHRTTR